MGNRTLRLAEIPAWSKLCRTPDSEKRAVEDMCDLINADVKRRSSSLPKMFLKAHAFATADLPIPHFARLQRIAHVFKALSSDYMAQNGLTKLSGYVPNRLSAFAKLFVDHKVSVIYQLPKAYLYAEDTDLRISLPNTFFANFDGRNILIVLYHDEKLPAHGKYGLSIIGQAMAGGFSMAFSDRLACDRARKILQLSIPIEDILLVDVARQRKDKGPTLRYLSSIPARILAIHKEDLADTLGRLNNIYAKACDVLGIEPDEVMASDDLPDEAGGSDESFEDKKSA